MPPRRFEVERGSACRVSSLSSWHSNEYEFAVLWKSSLRFFSLLDLNLRSNDRDRSFRETKRNESVDWLSFFFPRRYQWPCISSRDTNFEFREASWRVSPNRSREIIARRDWKDSSKIDEFPRWLMRATPAWSRPISLPRRLSGFFNSSLVLTPCFRERRE